MTNTQNPKEKLQAWFENPNTPADAWETWTLKDLEIGSGVSTTSILKYLPELVKTRHPEITGYAAFKQARRKAGKKNRKKGEPISDEDIVRIQTLRLTKTIHETVELTGYSATTVQRYSGKSKKRK